MTDRHRKFREMLATEKFSDDFIEDLESKLAKRGYFTAPASTIHHGNYAGGLFDHSYLVATWLKNMTDAMCLCWQAERSPVLIGLFHDLCKVDAYTVVNGNYTRATDVLLKGHGDKSVMMLSEYFKLTEEEIMCIRYHMGAFCDKEEWNDYTRAVRKYPLVLWTHTADMLATHVEGV